MRRPLVHAAALLLLGVAGCQDASLVAPVPAPASPAPAAGATLQVALDCRADVASHSLACAPTPGATPVVPARIAAAVIVGGQNVYVRLAQVASNYDAVAGVLASAVTITNLTSQPMGSADGLTLDPAGVRVFFHTLPVVTGGTGAVTVRNADGAGTFTASGEPYFSYPEIITGNATSSAKTWFFNMPPTVSAFTFQVYVQTTLRDERTPLAQQPAHSYAGQLVASGRTTCALRPLAGAYCWGDNSDGTLGTAALIGSARPFSAAVGPTLTSIVSGGLGSTACGLTASGAAFCWGANANGQIGDGTTTARPKPTSATMPGGVAFTSIAIGLDHSCALTAAGAAWCWGSNATGQLGNGTRTRQFMPTPVTMPPGVTFASIALGDTFSCALTGVGNAYCWGENFHGQLGTGDTVQHSTPAAVVMPVGRTFTSLALGLQFSCGLATTGAAYCWGVNNNRQLGDGTATQRLTPRAVSMPGGVLFAQLAAGYAHSCGLTAAGKPYCWGYNVWGQIGDSTTTVRSTPTAVKMPGGVSFAGMSLGSSHSCGLTAAGAAYCWGLNTRTQLGDGTSASRLTPTAVVMPAGVTFASIASFATSSCGRSAAGDTYCWGNNADGQLGNLAVPARGSSSSPLLVVGSSAFTQLAGGAGQHVCALTGAGAAWCWGNNDKGQLGDGTTTQRPAPTAVALPAGTTFTDIAVGASHSCGLTAAGTAYCWGYNANGQIGDNTATSRLTPTAVAMPGGVTFTSIAAGGNHSCGLTAAGATYCWGSNHFAQLGNNTQVDAWTPSPVYQSGATFAGIALGATHSCALSASGAAYCWGDNSYAKLGDGTAMMDGVPTNVVMPGGVSFTALALGADHTCALANTGAAYCWGSNGSWQAGDPNSTMIEVPRAVTVPGGVTFTGIAAGTDFTCGTTAAGAVYCWGNDNFGQLGDGGGSQSTPVRAQSP